VLNTSVNLGIIDLITETLGLININTIGIGLGGLAVVDPVVTETGFIRVRPGEFFDIK
jgi:hypothetical protein